jgi:hypothetical protein
MTRNSIIYSGHVVLLGQLHTGRTHKCGSIVHSSDARSVFVEGTTSKVTHGRGMERCER